MITYNTRKPYCIPATETELCNTNELMKASAGGSPVGDELPPQVGAPKAF